MAQIFLQKPLKAKDFRWLQLERGRRSGGQWGHKCLKSLMCQRLVLTGGGMLLPRPGEPSLGAEGQVQAASRQEMGTSLTTTNNWLLPTTGLCSKVDFSWEPPERNAVVRTPWIRSPETSSREMQLIHTVPGLSDPRKCRQQMSVVLSH